MCWFFLYKHSGSLERIPQRRQHWICTQNRRRPLSIQNPGPWTATEMKSVCCNTYLLRSSNLHISSQDLVGSQLHGFAWGLSRPTPPVRRNFHSSSSTSFFPLSRLTHNNRENSNWKTYFKTLVYCLTDSICYVWHAGLRILGRGWKKGDLAQIKNLWPSGNPFCSKVPVLAFQTSEETK